MPNGLRALAVHDAGGCWELCSEEFWLTQQTLLAGCVLIYCAVGASRRILIVDETPQVSWEDIRYLLYHPPTLLTPPPSSPSANHSCQDS